MSYDNKTKSGWLWLTTIPMLCFSCAETSSTASSSTRFMNGSKPLSTPVTCRLPFNFTEGNKGYCYIFTLSWSTLQWPYFARTAWTRSFSSQACKTAPSCTCKYPVRYSIGFFLYFICTKRSSHEMKNVSGPFDSEIIRHPSDFSQL